jgi:hypothetical protein
VQDASDPAAIAALTRLASNPKLGPLIERLEQDRNVTVSIDEDVARVAAATFRRVERKMLAGPRRTSIPAIRIPSTSATTTMRCQSAAEKPGSPGTSWHILREQRPADGAAAAV